MDSEFGLQACCRSWVPRFEVIALYCAFVDLKLASLDAAE